MSKKNTTRAFMEYSDKELTMWARFQKLLVLMTSANKNEADAAQHKVREFFLQHNLKWEERPAYMRGDIEKHFPANKHNGKPLRDIFRTKTVKTVAKKLTATQINKDCPKDAEQWGNQIVGHYKKALQYEGKAEQQWIAIGQYLAKAKEACDAGGFEAFRQKFCPAIGKSRTYELLQIGTSKKTVEELKSATRKRVAKHRAKAAAVSVTVTDEDPAVSADETVRLSGGQAIDVEKLSPAAQAQIAKALTATEDNQSSEYTFEDGVNWLGESMRFHGMSPGTLAKILAWGQAQAEELPIFLENCKAGAMKDGKGRSSESENEYVDLWLDELLGDAEAKAEFEKIFAARAPRRNLT